MKQKYKDPSLNQIYILEKYSYHSVLLPTLIWMLCSKIVAIYDLVVDKNHRDDNENNNFFAGNIFD